MKYRGNATRDHPWYYYVIYATIWLLLPVIGLIGWTTIGYLIDRFLR
jgi:hypothetical protein